MMMVRKPVSSLPSIPVTIGVALVMAWVTMPLVTVDMPGFLMPWFDHIAATGPIAAFAEPFSDYAPPYLYLLALLTLFKGLLPTMTLIKLLSIAGTVPLLLAVRHLLIRLDAPERDKGVALFLVMPTILLNATLLGQCDGMWAAPCVMGVAAAIDRKHAAMLAWCGLALGFKAQAVLIAPFFLALLIKRRVPLIVWPIAPLVTIATLVPAWAAGWPADNLATIYLRQAGTYPALSFNAPNIWAILQVAAAWPAATRARHRCGDRRDRCLYRTLLGADARQPGAAVSRAAGAPGHRGAVAADARALFLPGRRAGAVSGAGMPRQAEPRPSRLLVQGGSTLAIVRLSQRDRRLRHAGQLSR